MLEIHYPGTNSTVQVYLKYHDMRRYYLRYRMNAPWTDGWTNWRDRATLGGLSLEGAEGFVLRGYF